ncbi:E3 ubiquitin-protein ligase TRIM71-like [Saccostrea echinata]|uniref:E3 ubiquitin-protein ligase TRIM71-like n=1 Tax=Saccostrea echinata TaxID=191078 RepID=UPI002A83EBAB|nr:E3 ubiquitin-protein ligase TRIM71-like [Saccostrea echinata]
MAQAQDVILCQYCEETAASSFCVPCGDEICPRCKPFHLKSKVPSGHNVIPISGRTDPCNTIKMCEIHGTKPYEVCCEECELPLCILCVEESHGKHSIGKLKDLYEKQKDTMLGELSQITQEFIPLVIENLEDMKSNKLEVKQRHANMREKMKEHADQAIALITSTLNDKIKESLKEEKKEEDIILQHEGNLEIFLQQLHEVIQKYENLTNIDHPANLIMYRKQNPDVKLKIILPSKLELTPSSFTPGQLVNINQFGRVITSKINYYSMNTKKVFSPPKRNSSTKKVKTRYVSKKKNAFTKNISNLGLYYNTLLPKPKKVYEINLHCTGNTLYDISCVDDKKAYIYGGDYRILLIDISGNRLAEVHTITEPSDLAVMNDETVIYSGKKSRRIFRVSPCNETTEFTDTEYEPSGLCCTKSGDVLVCMGHKSTAKIVRYNSRGEKIDEIQYDMYGNKLYDEPRFVSENVNGDICVIDWTFPDITKVVDEHGFLRWTYDGNIKINQFVSFTPRGIATDSLGHVLISDIFNSAVHLINQDGHFISCILKQINGILRPCCIAVDKSDNMWVAEKEDTSIKVFKYLS